MSFKPLFCLLAATCVFSLGFAQCPDSVHVYVNPQVICPGEVAHLSTDSIICTNVGDIICVHNVSLDTIIVTPEEWMNLGLSSTYTPLSVVFYVDETCHHGWAVKATTANYEKKKWGINNPLRHPNTDESELTNFVTEAGSNSDLNGYSNTQHIRTNHTNSTYHPAFDSPVPFYLPAMGQLNILFSVKNRVSQVLTNASCSSLPDNDYNWWSSTENGVQNAWSINKTGTISITLKITDLYVLPVMNF